jgi:glyoxylase-like metal-dependent hydrolase (beta-lactamase superfamily II)
MLHRDVNEPIAYEFGQAPPAGTTMPVVDGLRWLRMPLPFALEHINLWILDDGPALTLVDTGVAGAESQRIWEDALDGASVDRVMLTHMHPDHSGCAGWLCNELDAGLWMSREEYLLCRVLCADTGRDAPPAGIDFYHAAGFPPEALDRYQKMFGMFGRLVGDLPDTYVRLRDGHRVDIGGHSWEVIVGRGHSPEHACLFDADRNLLISGDQILPTISSNVSVFPTEPAADPLDDWLTSLRHLKERIPQDVLVLPAHGRPFRGAHHRLDQLVDEHESSLDDLLDYCGEPRRVVDVFPVLFRAPIRDGNLIMATGESIAHLNYLINQGELEKNRSADGVDWYRRRT